MSSISSSLHHSDTVSTTLPETHGDLTFWVQGETKPLLLLAYLLLEGPTARGVLGHLFWPTLAQPANNLNVALSQLRKWNVSLRVEFGIVRVIPSLGGGSQADLAASGFLSQVHLRNVGSELEAWVLGQREQIARQLQNTLLTAAQRCPEKRVQLTEQAWQVPGAPLPDARTLARFLCLCRTGTEVHIQVQQELAELTDGWQTSAVSRPGQALLAWWLDGGLVRLDGESATVTAALAELQETLQRNGLPCRRLVVRPGTSLETLHRLVGTLVQDDLKTQTAVLDAPGLQADAVQLLQLQWPEIRFIVLSAVPVPDVFTLIFKGENCLLAGDRPADLRGHGRPSTPRRSGVDRRHRWANRPSPQVLYGCPAPPGPPSLTRVQPPLPGSLRGRRCRALKKQHPPSPELPWANGRDPEWITAPRHICRSITQKTHFTPICRALFPDAAVFSAWSDRP